MRSKVFVLLALAVAPSVVSSQSSPITRPKQSAQRAVTATNAHTAAMTDTLAGGRTATVTSAGNAEMSPARRDSTPPNADTTRTRVTTSKGATASKAERAVFEREVFSYERAGRRDPFISLMTSGEIRPLLADLRLVGIAYDPSGRNSVAVLREDAQDPNAGAAGRAGNRDMKNVPMYRVKEGQQLGRMRVARIGQKTVTFTIEEFGYSRQETLTVSDSNTERKP